jgi:hypothetical protein
MAVGDWSAATLATYEDVTDRYARAYDLTGETVLGNQQAKITNFLTRAKENIGRLLNAHLRERWVEMDLDTDVDIKDYIENPTVFKQAAVAACLAFLFEDNAFEEGDFHHLRMGDNAFEEGDFHHLRMGEYRQEFQREYKLGLSLVDFDSDASGEITADEKAVGPGGARFYRS